MSGRIKPLTWVPDEVFGGERGKVGDIQYRYVKYDWGGPSYGYENFATMDEAKAKAEADHNAFIRNAIQEDE